jgi:HPt (histidine-containing phosphotransfer) domain-containing protein
MKPYMDFVKLSERLGLEKEEYLELISLFLQTGKSDVIKIDKALAEENAPDASKAAHSLKGSSGSLGLETISKHAKQIENLAKENRLEDILEILKIIKFEIVKLAKTVQ